MCIRDRIKDIRCACVILAFNNTKFVYFHLRRRKDAGRNSKGRSAEQGRRREGGEKVYIADGCGKKLKIL